MESDIEMLKREVGRIKRQVVNLEEDLTKGTKNKIRIVERHFIDGEWEEGIDSISEDAESEEMPRSPNDAGSGVRTATWAAQEHLVTGKVLFRLLKVLA